MELLLQNQPTADSKEKLIITPISKSYNSIDLMKFICSILVICIHTHPLSTYSNILNSGLDNVIARLAVPFFFISAGYFFFNKIDLTSSSTSRINHSYLKSYIKRLSLLYIIWSIIYLPYTLYLWVKSDASIIKYIFSSIRNFLLTGISTHLWYMAALILATILVYYTLRYFSLKNTLLIGLILYIIGLLGDSYFGLINKVPVIGLLFNIYNFLFVTTRNGLFFGFIFVAFGAYLSHTKFIISTKKICMLFCLSFLLMGIEVFTLKVLDIPKNFNMYIFLVPTVIFLFLLLLNMNLKPHPLYSLLRKLSILIYFSHFIFYIIYPKLFSLLSLNAIYNNSIFKFLFILISSIICSLFLIWLSHFKSLKFLKVFY